MDSPDPGDGYAEAFDRYAPVILRYAQRRLGGQDGAWDVVTDTFTAAWRHWERRPAPQEMLPWLYAIAGNSVRDQQRSAQRRRRLIARLSALPTPRPAADPAESVVLTQSITDALARLPEADQEILRLIAWEGQTDARVLGLVLGLSAGTARSRVHRARRRLRAALADAGQPDAGSDSAAHDGGRRSASQAADGSRPRGGSSADPARTVPAQLRQHAKEA